jgi:CotH kinase protein/Lamin Tail Domain
LKYLIALLTTLILLFSSASFGTVVINEIMYHPDSDIYDASWEYIELHNTSDLAVDLGGYFFISGITYTFPTETILPASGYLVVAADADEVRNRYSISNVVGNFSGRLSDGGERITLLSATGEFIDSVRYNDGDSWPVAPDGQGSSLECLNPLEDNDTPANWRGANSNSPIGVWRQIRITGTGSITGDRSSVYIYLDSAGECLIDNVSVLRDGSLAEHIKWGDFESPQLELGSEYEWRGRGNHSGSFLSNDTIFGGTCAHIVSTGKGGSSSNSFQQYRLLINVAVGQPYTISMWAKFITLDTSLTVRFTGSGVDDTIPAEIMESWTPGVENSRHTDNLPPFIENVENIPTVPTPNDDTVVLAAISDGDAIASATLKYNVLNGAAVWQQMHDDGLHSDGVAGDGIYGATMMRLPNESITRYWIVAEDTHGATQRYPELSEPTPNRACFTWNHTPNTPLRIVWLYCEEEAWEDISKTVEVPCIIVVDGIVYDHTRFRWRGNTAIGNPKKNFKFRFNKDNRARGKKTWNLNGDMVDKSYMHSAVSWEICKRMGVPYAQTESHHLRIRPGVGGFTFWGLYVYIEQFNEQFLERMGLDDKGNLYKSASDQRAYSSYNSRYRKNSNEEANDYSDLEAFIAGFNVYYTAQPQVSLAQAHSFLLANMNVDEYIDYLCSMTLIGNVDQVGKNQFLYHNPDDGRWMKIPWDLDLVLGQNFDPDGGSSSILYSSSLFNNIFTINTPILTGSRQHPKWKGSIWNKLTDRFLARNDGKVSPQYDDPYATPFRTAYLARLRGFLDSFYTTENLYPFIDDYKALINDDGLADAVRWKGYARSGMEGEWIFPGDFDRGYNRIKDFIVQRRAYLYQEIAAFDDVPTRTPTPMPTPTCTPTPTPIPNLPPVWFAPEAVTLPSGSGHHDDLIQLASIVTDDHTPASAIRFRVVSQSAPGKVNVTVTTDGTLSAFALSGAVGLNRVVIAAEDSDGAISWITIKFYVMGATGVDGNRWQQYR